MFERQLIRLVRDEITSLAADNFRLPRHMVNLGLSATEAEAVRTYLSGSTIQFFQEIQRLFDVSPPAVCVTLEDDAETRGFLGEEGSLIDQLESEVLGNVALERNQHRATTFRTVHGVYVSVEANPDALGFLYEAVKGALIRARPDILGVPGTDSVVIRGGPLAVDASKAPTNWLFRRIGVTVERRYEIAPREPAGRVRTLGPFQLLSETEAIDEDGVVWTRAAGSSS